MLLRAVRINAEITLAHKLKGIACLCIPKTTLQAAASQSDQGIRVDVFFKCIGIRWVFGAEQPIIKPNLGLNAVNCTDPMERALNLAAVRGIAALACRVIGAVQANDMAVVIRFVACAGDEISAL